MFLSRDAPLMKACPCLLALLWTSATAQSPNGRNRLPFDFGWRFRTGLHDWAKPDEPAPAHTDPGLTPAESGLDYDDSQWRLVSLPHDGLIGNEVSFSACPDGCSGHSYIPRHVLWYRKTFSIPAEWEGSAYFLDFQGSFRNTTVWLNGALVSNHVCGYTPFRVRLDNVTSVKAGSKVVLAVFVDPDNGDMGGRDHGSGWWYEGGGLYRSVSLVRTSKLHVEQDGFFVHSSLLDGSSATLYSQVDLVNQGSDPVQACVIFGVEGASNVSSSVLVAPGGSGRTNASMDIKQLKLWSSSTPSLYKVTAKVYAGSCGGKLLDEVEVMHGFRSLRFDADEGMFLNGEHFKVRGFCDHDSFAVVGMAMPPRIDLFRAQASRAVGGNGRRASHNPPNPDLLDIYDRIGIVVMDENRLFNKKAAYVENFRALVKRDRNHPAVIIWSFCNEADCEGSHELAGPAFQATSSEHDGTRPTLANMFTFKDLLSNTIDIQGFSHQERKKLEACHAALPKKPIFMSECCSCRTMRDEDVGLEAAVRPGTTESFNARCTESNSQTNASDGVNWAAGTMVWTLFDYYGEPVQKDNPPQVSSTFGQFDMAGFPKAAAFWYRVQWLLSIEDNPDKTFPTHNLFEVHIVESWESPDAFPSTKGQTTRVVHAYSNAPFIELFVNKKSQGLKAVKLMRQGPGSYAEWPAVPWEAGELLAVAKDASGRQLAQDSRQTNGNAVGLEVTLDVPSKATGTGSALLLDGQDVALVRAAVVDANGRVVHLASNNITFTVVSGPGMVMGANNGNARCREPNNVPWHSAYHGLVRGVVRVTATSAIAGRALLAQIDGEGPLAGKEEVDEGPQPIVVEASSPGFAPVQLSIPTSNDAETHGVYAVAAAGAGQPVNFFERAPESPIVVV